LGIATIWIFSILSVTLKLISEEGSDGDRNVYEELILSATSVAEHMVTEEQEEIKH
jgi:hypothetical protein